MDNQQNSTESNIYRESKKINKNEKKDMNCIKDSEWSRKRNFALFGYTRSPQIPGQQKKYPYTWMCKFMGVRKLPINM